MKTTAKDKRRRMLRKYKRQIREGIAWAAEFDKEIRRLHPECGTTRTVGELQRSAVEVARAMRRAGRAQLLMVRIFEAINEES